MSEYIAGANAALRSDMELLLALDAAYPDAQGLARALTNGGGSAGSVELEHLLSVATRRQGSIEIVRRLPSGRFKSALSDYVDTATWAKNGMPLKARLELIRNLRSGEVVIQARKNRGVGAGQPRTVLCPDAASGAAIWNLALKLATGIDDRPTTDYDREWLEADGWLTKGVDAWISRERNGRAKRNLSEIDTWERKVRRALSAYEHLLVQLSKSAN
ncbi:hypothetical protein [Sphingomonas sp. RB1R13]|uniref:hypothetical protein n=1 Tax=Sphingomonas sp. RB1R13 TaxID=3096159 RepID=UPI002FC9269E